MSEVIATAEFRGATRQEIFIAAINAFEAFQGEPYFSHCSIVVGTAEEIGARIHNGVAVPFFWKATCHLVSKETAT
jgi:hypothetical protein